MSQEIINFLETIGPLSQPCVKALHSLLVIEELGKKNKLLEPGQVSDRVYFILKGVVRCYYVVENNNEITCWIMKEQDVIISVGSFYSQQPGNDYIETLEPTIVGSISYDEMQRLYTEFQEFNWIGRILTERYNVLADRRANDLRISSASEKYRIFKERHPELDKRVARKYIASYLGIKKETLYKIRSGNYNSLKKKNKKRKKK